MKHFPRCEYTGRPTRKKAFRTYDGGFGIFVVREDGVNMLFARITKDEFERLSIKRRRVKVPEKKKVRRRIIRR